MTARTSQALFAVNRPEGRCASAEALRSAWTCAGAVQPDDRLDADVKVNPRYGEFDDASLQVVDATAEDVPGAEEGGIPAPTPTGGTTPTEPPG